MLRHGVFYDDLGNKNTHLLYYTHITLRWGDL